MPEVDTLGLDYVIFFARFQQGDNSATKAVKGHDEQTTYGIGHLSIIAQSLCPDSRLCREVNYVRFDLELQYFQCGLQFHAYD